MGCHSYKKQLYQWAASEFIGSFPHFDVFRALPVQWWQSWSRHLLLNFHTCRNDDCILRPDYLPSVLLRHDVPSNTSSFYMKSLTEYSCPSRKNPDADSDYVCDSPRTTTQKIVKELRRRKRRIKWRRQMKAKRLKKGKEREYYREFLISQDDNSVRVRPVFVGLAPVPCSYSAATHVIKWRFSLH